MSMKKYFVALVMSITISMALLGCGKSQEPVAENITEEVVQEAIEEPASVVKEPEEVEPEIIEEEEVAAEPEFSYEDLSEIKYAKSTVNVRSLPNKEGEKLGALSTNDEVTVTGKCNETNWYRIEYKGQVAFVSNDFLVDEKLEVKPDVIVCIDPGHGGDGEKHRGVAIEYDDRLVEEKDLNLSIALKLRDILEQRGITVVMTRTGNSVLDLSERVDIAKKNNADYLVSVHNNSSSRGLESDSGCLVIATQSNYNGCYEDSNGLANSILAKLNGIGLPFTSDWDANVNGGILHRTSEKGATYKDGSAADYYGLISRSVEASIPGVIIEHAFVSSPSDYYEYLSDDDKLARLAQADADGIIDFLTAKGRL